MNNGYRNNIDVDYCSIQNFSETGAYKDQNKVTFLNYVLKGESDVYWVSTACLRPC